MDNETKWGGVWPFGTITLPIEPAPGMLVAYEHSEDGVTKSRWSPIEDGGTDRFKVGRWHGNDHYISGPAWHIIDTCTPLLPPRAQLEAAGLSVWDGLKLLFDDMQGALELKLPGEYRIVTASGESFALAQPSWIEDEDELKLADDARQIYTALLAWVGGSDEH